jgi:hypothetical protein
MFILEQGILTDKIGPHNRPDITLFEKTNIFYLMMLAYQIRVMCKLLIPKKI